MTFLFDEQMPPRLTRALKILGESVTHVEDFQRGAPDEIILKHAAQHSYCLITMDRRISKRPHERAAYLKAGIGIYFIKSARKQTTDLWELVELIIKQRRAIKLDAEERKPPFMMLVTKRRLDRF